MNDKIKEYYAHGIEKDRLEQKLEGIRSKEIIERYLGKDNLDIIDIGGGAGYYSFWLQSKGHRITLVDLSSENIELVKKHSQSSGIQLSKIEECDARNLKFNDGQFDIALLFGPLYHLTGRQDRLKALTEAKRVVKPGGIILCAIISRYASLFDGFKRDLVNDWQFEKLLKADLVTGIHLNETDNLEYFTTAFFHTPAEIKEEISESGLHFEKLIAVESFGWVIDSFEKKSKDSTYMNRLLHFIKAVESNDDLMEMSPHIIAVAQKKI
jgi:ubiquinone/menaquinone biosynthesis C-methylase UbiE